MQKLSALCGAQPRCRARFGNLHAHIEETFRTLHTKPFDLRDGPDKQTRTITALALFSILQSMTMDTANWYLLPQFIEDVRRRQETPLVTALYDGVMAPSADTGIWLATECRERAPFDRRLTGDPKWPHLTRAALPDIWLRACAKWPAKRTANWQTPQNTTIPALVIGGGLDPVTPASDAKATATRLGAKAQLLHVPLASHSAVSSFPCVKSAIEKFLTNPATPVTRLCDGEVKAPELAARIVKFDLWSEIEKVVSNLGVSQPLYWLAVIWAGLLVAIIWPSRQLPPQEANHAPARFWARSSFWLPLSGWMVWGWLFGQGTAALNDDPAAANWTSYGIPTHAWPAFSLIIPAMLAGAAGTYATVQELRRSSLNVTPTIQRLWVITSLATVFAAIWQGGALPDALGQVSDDIDRLISVFRS
jgi:hypothetical protein